MVNYKQNIEENGYYEAHDNKISYEQPDRKVFSW